MSEHAVQYREIAPPPALAPFVRCIWRLHGTGGAGSAEPIIPDGRAEIIVNVGDPFIRHMPDGTWHRQPLRLVAGQLTRALTLEPSGRIDIWGIRFHPWCAATFLGASASELRDRLFSLDDVARPLDRAFSAVGEACSEAAAERAIVDALVQRASRLELPSANVPRLVTFASASSE